MRLHNKVALITGGCGGIGLATAKLFLAQGAKVMLADIDGEQLEKVCAEIDSNSVSSVVCDVTKEVHVKNMVGQTVSKFGTIDVFVANAGIEGKVGNIVDTEVENFRTVIEINVVGVWLGLRHVVPVMQGNGGGSIMITSSIAGVNGTAGHSPYNTSKHAVIGMMRCAALEYAADNIRINTVNPGCIETRMMRSIEEGFVPGDGQKFKEIVHEMIPMGRYGLPEEVANMMLFLASDESCYCTGSVYMVDGGFST
ncbi:SDR family oxidoreductase [Halioxenophilus sp. WMMB6]|uniref:SDR family NAD(P)-dependent oxidoreductase n=1 Tax=Halioxenophilus sp. WMMB6 TaxID=3073815 RepID=UPI00295F4209|nr:SDR family oxidoreductase [Halioxenophilus sp. WMMB6]